MNMERTSPSANEMSPADKIHVAEQCLARQLDWIKAVEAKVSVLVAMNVATLGVLVTRIPEQPNNWWLVGLFAFLGGGCFVTSLVFCLLASFPRTKSPNLSLLFFGSISDHSSEEYTKRFGSLTENDYLDDVLKQVYRNAEIAGVKFGNVKCATGFLLGGILPWLVSLYVMGVL